MHRGESECVAHTGRDQTWRDAAGSLAWREEDWSSCNALCTAAKRCIDCQARACCQRKAQPVSARAVPLREQRGNRHVRLQSPRRTRRAGRGQLLGRACCLGATWPRCAGRNVPVAQLALCVLPPGLHGRRSRRTSSGRLQVALASEPGAAQIMSGTCLCFRSARAGLVAPRSTLPARPADAVRFIEWRACAAPSSRRH